MQSYYFLGISEELIDVIVEFFQINSWIRRLYYDCI